MKAHQRAAQILVQVVVLQKITKKNQQHLVRVPVLKLQYQRNLNLNVVV